MKSNDEFYIGYFPKAPKSIAKWIMTSVIILVISIAILSLLQARNQENLQANNFEFGKITELTGILQTTPVPNLVIHNGQDINGNDLFQSVLLIGLGKFGSDSLVSFFKNKIDLPLNQTEVTLRGTLIYSDGKTLLELTEEENALVKSVPLDSSITISSKKIGRIELNGEMIDSKCYFGVMNPGYGKPHRSCAIRCVSGGIPPVFWSTTEDKATQYYIVLGKNGEAINQQVLPYIADPICIKGEVYQYLDWHIIQTDIENEITAKGCSGF
ncbi:MAG: hypothetical protein ACPG19_10955 [Saprospiraceae bacterium]